MSSEHCPVLAAVLLVVLARGPIPATASSGVVGVGTSFGYVACPFHVPPHDLTCGLASLPLGRAFSYQNTRGSHHRSPVYDKWTIAASADRLRLSNTTFSWNSSGTVEQNCLMLGNASCHFSGSDSTLNPEQRKLMPDAWLLPVMAGAVSIAFNLPNSTCPNSTSLALVELMIPRETLANIFLGRIRQWSELAHWNPALASVQQSIELVVRSDGSGISETLSRALSSFSTEWNSKVGTSFNPRWPWSRFVATSGNAMAITILATPYSLGFMSQMAATTFGLPVARISNAMGAFIAPTLSGVQSAMDVFTDELDELRAKGETVFFQSIVDPQSKQNAYPISMFTYWAFDPAQLNCKVLHDVLYLIYWAWTNPEAAQTAMKMGSSPISEAARNVGILALARLQCDRASPMVKVVMEVTPGCAPGKPARTL
jgi:phosphate transport system substrate-binding protein